MKKIIIPAAICIFALWQMGCNKDSERGLYKATSKIVLNYPVASTYHVAASGLNYFNKAVIALKDAPTDTISFEAVIPYPLDKDVTISIAVDEAAATAYNNDASHTTKYPIAPAANYSIVNSSATLTAGQTSAIFKLAIKPQQFDIGASGYMIPISITGDPGVPVIDDMKTIYFHVEKDPTPPYDRTGWTATASSEATEEQQWAPAPQGTGLATLDGNPATIWHSIWDPAYHGLAEAPGFPHWIAVDMKTDHVLHGIYFLERQNGSGDKVKDVTVSTSTDGVTWTEAAHLTLANSTAWQKIPFTPTPAVRYFKTTFTSNFSGALWTNMAEIKPY